MFCLSCCRDAVFSPPKKHLQHTLETVKTNVILIHVVRYEAMLLLQCLRLAVEQSQWDLNVLVIAVTYSTSCVCPIIRVVKPVRRFSKGTLSESSTTTSGKKIWLWVKALLKMARPSFPFPFPQGILGVDWGNGYLKTLLTRCQVPSGYQVVHVARI